MIFDLPFNSSERSHSRLAAAALFVFAAVTGTIALAAVPPGGFVEGTHYERLPLAVSTRDGNKIEVIEVFSYACVHCFNFDPAVEEWRETAGEDISFERLPAVFNNTWKMLAQAFYSARVLDVSDQMHKPIFEALHNRGMDLRDPALMGRMFETFGGVKPDEFKSVFDSFSVRSLVQQADAKGRAFRVQGVPAMVVNGKYKVDGRMAGDNSSMIEVVNYLVEIERREAGMASKIPQSSDAPAAPDLVAE